MYWRNLFQKCNAHSWKMATFSHGKRVFALLLIIFCLSGCTSTESPVSTSHGPSPELSPDEALESFQIESGLKLQLVASEPMIQDPVVSTFDEDGKLWVVEMRAYMPNMEGEGEREPIGRISVLRDTDGNGIMDASTVYMDSLIMPRAVAVVSGGVLVVFEEALWMTRDLNGDLKADSRTLIDPDYAGSTLPEHSGNGLWRGVDNWYYNAKSRYRYRQVNDKWVKDSTEFRGQWGLSHDDAGRLYYNYNWSQLHADLVPPNYMSSNKNHTPVTGIDQGLTLEKTVYPVRPTPAVNRGYIPGILDEEKKLKEFTAACSPFVYRGTALPRTFYGNVFVCEPSGNLVKRNVVKERGYNLTAHDPHPGKEFLASTDERFRPVHIAQGPDGALYLVDMYRGLIQHKAYVTPYLKEQTLERELVQPIHRGRIWRIVPENWTHKPTEGLSNASSRKLVGLLSSNDGWYRDIAQRLLVDRKDDSALPELTDLVRKGAHRLGRFHALWTLEGLNALSSDLLFDAVEDSEPLVSNTALRLLESFAAQDPEVRAKLEVYMTARVDQSSPQQVLQMAFSSRMLDEKTAHDILLRIASRYDTSALIRDAVLSSIADKEFAFMRKLLASAEWKDRQPGKEIFLEMLTSSVVRKSERREVMSMLAMLDVPRERFGWRENTILTGMAIQGYGGKIKPLRLTSPPGILRRKDLNVPDSQIQGLAALFQWPGSLAQQTTQQKGVALNAEEKEQFALGRKFYLSSCSGCHGNDGGGLNRFAPPLKGSEWVLGDERRLALIVLHGIEGPLVVAGKRYAEPEILPVMPGHSTLGDGTIAAILTYIRNEWDNAAGAVSRKTVGTVRLTNQGRVLPWTAEELARYLEQNQAEASTN